MSQCKAATHRTAPRAAGLKHCNCTAVLQVLPKHEARLSQQLFKTPAPLPRFPPFTHLCNASPNEVREAQANIPLLPSRHPASLRNLILPPLLPLGPRVSTARSCASAHIRTARQRRDSAPLRGRQKRRAYIEETGEKKSRKKERKSCSSLRAGWNGELSS